MNAEDIRKAIAEDLRGTPSRNPDSLYPEMSKLLKIRAEDVVTQMHRMEDLGHIAKVGQASIRLTEEGSQYYFSTKQQVVTSFLKDNWPNILSNAIAFIALVISIYSLNR
ncbi:hypothetical protein COU14_03330 [Candidatus Kaiserbacteria bacterium CG10_big_fil_rev_8_21_14_0_10_44_10]|uniref:Uncharacterized protein n=1 Tax=Candidatus Kaiserbacteria bacterium CG10_big_fil_rev_8_21_14_0_10_44_10 TaxID=1974606 RepID=A0A2H0UGY2_9BACT|nr:MAG: hypothetical protein COU14_03330 [Candidatus Kaiserbacteria bacterium CG10_big_fil_rev_8_21_14_0_10_44_10]